MFACCGDPWHILQAAERADAQAFLEQPSSRLNQLQLEPDSAYLQEAPLWAAYRLCAARARKANAARTAHSVALLTASYGQKLVFGREARANIDPKNIDRIRCYACLTPVCLGSQQNGLSYGMQAKVTETVVMQTHNVALFVLDVILAVILAVIPDFILVILDVVFVFVMSRLSTTGIALSFLSLGLLECDP